jgi:glycosyltransferase involved in cell wall biosynthesis
MRVSFIGPLPPHPGGIAQHGSNLVEALRQSHSVEVIQWNLMYPPLKNRGWGQIANDDSGGLIPRWWNPLSWYQLGLAARKSDLVVVQYVHPGFALPLRMILRTAEPTPAVCVVHNLIPHEPFPLSSHLASWALKQSAVVIAHSQHVADELKWDGRVVVVPLPPIIPVRVVDPPPIPPLRLLFLGYVRRYKGLDLCIRAVGRAAQEGLDIELTVAGEFWESEDAYRELIEDEGLVERVNLIPGYVPDSQMSTYLEEHHAFVAPYRSATQSGLVPLALSAGRPVVGTDVGALSEQIVDGRNGILVSGHEVDDLAMAFKSLVHSYKELQAGTAESGSSWEDVVSAITRGVEEANQQ